MVKVALKSVDVLHIPIARIESCVYTNLRDRGSHMRCNWFPASLVFVAVIFTACTSAAQAQAPVWPSFNYVVPAVAEHGGPVYVIPGRVDGNTTIGFRVTGAACLQSPGIDCVNAAGVVTVAGTTPGSKAGDAPTFQANIGGFPISAGVGALLISIEGVGTVQAFAADSANGLHGAKAPTSLRFPQRP